MQTTVNMIDLLRDMYAENSTARVLDLAETLVKTTPDGDLRELAIKYVQLYVIGNTRKVQSTHSVQSTSPTVSELPSMRDESGRAKADATANAIVDTVADIANSNWEWFIDRICATANAAEIAQATTLMLTQYTPAQMCERLDADHERVLAAAVAADAPARTTAVINAICGAFAWLPDYKRYMELYCKCILDARGGADVAGAGDTLTRTDYCLSRLPATAQFGKVQLRRFKRMGRNSSSPLISFEKYRLSPDTYWRRKSTESFRI